MAHLAKYKIDQVSPLMRHYLRENKNYGNENINEVMTAMNYGWLGADDPEKYLSDKLAALPRKPRKDAVVMCDWVITLPEDVKEDDQEAFFGACVDFLHDRYGLDNLLCAEVHLDETTPHIHYAFIPFTEDGRLCAKEVITRADLKSFHGDLDKFVQRSLGYQVSIELSEDKKIEKAISKLPQDEMKKVYKELDKLVEKRDTLAVSVSAAAVRLSELEADIEALEEKKAALDETVTGLRKTFSELVDWYNENLVPPFERVRAFVKEGRVSEWVDELLEKFFKIDRLQERVSFFQEMSKSVDDYRDQNSDRLKSDEPGLGSSDFER